MAEQAISQPAPETPTAGADQPTPAAAPDAGQPTSTEVENAINKFNLSIRGQDKQFDLTNPDDVAVIKRMAQKGEAADQKFNEAAMTRKQAEDFIRLLKTDPKAVMEHPSIGLDAKKWAEEFLYERIKESQMSPEERERVQLKKKVQEFEEREKKAKEKEQQIQFQKEMEEYKGQLTIDIVKALETSALPKSPRSVARIAHYMMEAKKHGWKDVRPTDVVDMVWEDYVKEHNDLYGGLSDEKLKAILSPDFRKKIRALDLADIKTPGTRVPANDQPPPNPDKVHPSKKYLSRDDFKKMVAERVAE